MQYFLDTNVVIDILHNVENVCRNYQIQSIKGNEIVICPIVYYEVVRGFKIASATKKFESFLDIYKNWRILPFDMKVAQKSVEIYEELHKGQQIEDNDIFIAATAIINDCILVTSNTRHFQRVRNLNFVNWRE